MTDEDKCAAVDGLLALYGGWGCVSELIGVQNPMGAAWLAYQERRSARAKALRHIEDSALRWHMTWKPAFWDTIQEGTHEQITQAT